MAGLEFNNHTMPPMRRVRNVHFVGIGGAGMCGIAEVLIHLGYEVSGSDLVESEVTLRLGTLGASVHIGHNSAWVENCDVVVVSSAIDPQNVEVVAAHSRLIPVVSRAEMLGELMRHRFGIAVAGTHGKTTATSLMASIFQAAQLDPTFVIGGLVKSEGSHGRLGSSHYLIAEADESDASFLYLNPMLAVLTNIDHDHLGTYSHEFQNLLDAFKTFVHRLPFYGLVVACIDDEGVRSIIGELARPVLTYGFSPDADFRAINVRHEGITCKFRALRPRNLPPLDIEVSLPGHENVRNVLAAISVATDEGIEDSSIVQGILNFRGINRRFETTELNISHKSITLIDDYGHHPNEVLHVIRTTREIFPHRRLVMVYQPHRFTRTRDLFQEFVDALVQVDVLIVVDTYAASEAPICGAYGSDLSRAIQNSNTIPTHFAKDAARAVVIALQLLSDSDVLAIQGAGNVDQVSRELSGLAA